MCVERLCAAAVCLYPLLTCTPAPPPIASRRPPSHLPSLSLTARQAATREQRGQSESEGERARSGRGGQRETQRKLMNRRGRRGDAEGGVASTASPPGTSCSLPWNVGRGGVGGGVACPHVSLGIPAPAPAGLGVWKGGGETGGGGGGTGRHQIRSVSGGERLCCYTSLQQTFKPPPAPLRLPDTSP